MAILNDVYQKYAMMNDFNSASNFYRPPIEDYLLLVGLSLTTV